MIRVGIAGVGGRMGRLLVDEVARAGMVLAGGSDRAGGERATMRTPELARACDVLIDFTHASAAIENAHAVLTGGCAWVLGTSGLTASDETAVAGVARHRAVVQAANFSPGLVIMLDVARRLAAALPADAYDAEILEMHHRQKVDAPSGTAVAIGQAVAAGRGMALSDMRESGRDGQTGARATGAIGFASLRGGQVVGDHTLLFAAGHEHLSLTHRALDRGAFAAGAVRAAAWVIGQPAGLYGMANVLGLG